MNRVDPPTAGRSSPDALLPDVARTRAALDTVTPDLRAAFDAALPGARAAILGRLLGALDRETLPRLEAAGGTRGERRHVSGAAVRFDPRAARPFAEPPDGLAAHVTEPPTGTSGTVTDPAELAERLWPGHRLSAELANSVANLALARGAATLRAARTAHPAGAGHLARAAGDPDGLGRLEQLVTDGHPLHPGARTRAGMTTADVLAYGPEHQPVIRLRKLAVPPDRWYGDGPPVLYAHPWQAGRLRDAYPWLTDVGPTEPVRPLMSLRTVAPVGGGDHYKTAVDVQMTSAVRTVSPAAVHNGPRLSAALAALTADLPLTPLAETHAGAVLIDGEPHRRLAHLRREAPRPGPGETILPLGALAVPALLREAVDDPYDWMDALAPLLWTPLTRLLQRGVALEAHGQNTLVGLCRGRPVRTFYRDLGGVRVSTRLGLDLIGDLPTADPAVLRTKLAAAALGTVALQVITLLERHRGADPARLWATVAASVRAGGDCTLLREPLPVKATTAMRLAADPLDDQWSYLDNPMADYA